MTALELFRSGMDTMEIAQALNISEARAVLRIHVGRSVERGVEARFSRRAS